MPLFMDHHEKLEPMSPERAEQITHAIKNEIVDENGARGVNIYAGKDGQGFCLFEAPTSDAVLKAHQAAGVPLESGSVVEVTSLV